MGLGRPHGVARVIRGLRTRVGDRFYLAANFRRPHVLIYTDSRGFDVVARSRVNSYVSILRRRYRVTHVICPEKYTTIIDFLGHMDETPWAAYDSVILHCGIVDFSPRPVSGLQAIAESKKHSPRFRDALQRNQEYYARPCSVMYEGEPTINLYSQSFLVDALIPALRRIENLIWINSNNVVPGWEGNYVRGRPANLAAIVEVFDREMGLHLSRVVDLRAWTYNDVRRYTVDNIHFTAEGFRCVADLIDHALQRQLSEQASVGSRPAG
jgi:hypothetical protein